MNRRDFGKSAFAVAAVAVAGRSALAAELPSIVDCVVIDFERNARVWRNLEEPDELGRTFLFEETGDPIKYRHFQFLRADGLVIGYTGRMNEWTRVYDRSEYEFEHLFKPAAIRPFDRSEFLRYVEDVRYFLNGYVVPPEQLG